MVLVSLIAVVQVVLENFVQGACLAFVRDYLLFVIPICCNYLLFVIPLNIFELFIRETVALPGLVNGTEAKHMGLYGCVFFFNEAFLWTA